MPAKKTWRNSRGRALLFEDLRTGVIPLDGPVSATMAFEIYQTRPEYGEFGGFKNFPSRLKSARNIVNSKKGRAQRDAIALTHDREIHPIELNGDNPRWQGSSAEQWLAYDINVGNNVGKKPIQLYTTRPEYQVFTLKCFRGHVYQALNRRKFNNYFTGNEDDQM